MKKIFFIGYVFFMSVLWAQLGGWQEQDASSVEMITSAQEIVNLLQKENSQLQFVKIRKVSAQVVAGMNYRFELELSTSEFDEIWEIAAYRDLQGNYEITNKKMKSKMKKTKSIEPIIPDVPMPGGFEKQNLESKETKEAVAKVAKLAQEKQKGWKLVKAHKVAVQVVAGLNYFMLLEFESNKQKIYCQILAFQDFSGVIEIDKMNEIKMQQQTPKEAILHQVELIKKGDWEKLSALFTERIRDEIDEELVLDSQEEVSKYNLNDLVGEVLLEEIEGQKTAKIKMKNGRTLTTLILVDDQWLADTLWFR